MKVKVLAKDHFTIVGIMRGESCAADDFLSQGDANQESSRTGLRSMLRSTASMGLDNIPVPWSHEVDKQNGIYEFCKGRLRLFFFKGKNGQIAVCTGGTLKDSRKVDKPSVACAIRCKQEYFGSLQSGTLELCEDTGDNNET